MKEPKVVLKNVKTFRGHDGTGLNADIWINGINCMHVYDGAYGGEFEYTENTHNNPKAEQVKKNIALLHEYVNQLPEQEVQLGDKKVMIKYGLDVYIDEILIKQENEKLKKKNEAKRRKLSLTCILFGVPNANSYQYINYKRPLSSFPEMYLQNQIKMIKQKYCKDGIEILNTNLDGMII